MMHRNKEFTLGLAALTGIGLCFTLAGWAMGPGCAALAAAGFVCAGGIYCLTQRQRYRQLRNMAADLEALLHDQRPLPLENYREGELSILACQIQKLALQLTEAAQAVRQDKLFLADSLADISHQLRTPLTAMNLTASMLSTRDLDDDRRQELAKELRQLLKRTEWLVEALLKYSKLDAGTVTMAAKTVPVCLLVRRAAEPLAIPMELREQTLELPTGPEAFTGDLVWSAEALGNILKNAMEHTPIGGRITVTALETALYTQITVEDTGPGFAREDIPHLFERFYKGKNASDASYGIGLALARRVITAQGGTVQAMNGTTGAKFVIKFYKQTI